MTVYQIKVTLKHTKPTIWRRIEVASDIKLGKLHRVLQAAMGWTDSHLHAFSVGRTRYGVPDPEYYGDMINERNVRLDSITKPGDSIVYEYDFGDNWQHELKIEKSFPENTGTHYPRCAVAAGACPPEDCGGPGGYQHLLEVLKNPNDEEYKEMLEWVGGDFDPEALDIEEINQQLRRIK